MPDPLPVYECDGCGACCGCYMVLASRDDAVREPRIAEEGQRLAPWLETERWSYRLTQLPFHEACCFLDGDRLCSIYETRPQVCRDFAAGEEPCQLARVAKGLPPLESVGGRSGGAAPQPGEPAGGGV